MDYDLKCVLAFCFIAKIAALSIGNETEKTEQKFNIGMEALLLPSLAAQESLAKPVAWKNHSVHFNRDLGRQNFKHEHPSRKSLEESGTIEKILHLETCDQVMKLLKKPMKWWQIQKTLHWLNRVLASNKGNFRHCHLKEALEKRSESNTTKGNSGFPTSKRNKEKRKFKSFQFKMKERPNNLIVNRARDLINSSKSNIYLKRNKKLGKERKYKHKSRVNRLKKNKGNKEGRLKYKGKKKFRYNRKYFIKKGPAKHLDLLKDFQAIRNATILKPNSVLFDVRKVSFENMKETSKPHGNRKCQNLGSDVKSPGVKNNNDCLKKIDDLGVDKVDRVANQPTESGSQVTDVKSANVKHNEKSTKHNFKPWPHFVYHRVSSNFLHPEFKDQNHHQSAYVAISVAASSNTGEKETW